MQTREIHEKREKEFLAPYAQASMASLGRQHREEECKFRTAYYRDLGRIVHSTAFRLLEYKTQVFVNHEGDYYRTRLTHTLEVGQISRGLARILRVNEDLAQTIALAHDLGHAPFGHPGEEMLNILMKADGGFEHNIQSYRIVTELEERYPDFRGLNLTYEVLEGLVKHSTGYDKPPQVEDFKDVGFLTIESQIVNCADEIAFMNHDLDDGLHWGMLSMESLKEVPLWEETFCEMRSLYPTATERIHRCKTISGLIGKLIDDLQEESGRRIMEMGIKTLDDVRQKGNGVVSFSEKMKGRTDEAKNFLFANVYRHPNVVEMSKMGSGVIRDLFGAYVGDSEKLPEKFCARVEATGSKRHICDYIAGMTDRFALGEHNKLFDRT